VIPLLQRNGYTVRAVQLAEQSLADDVALVRHAAVSIGRPVVLVGHSYGGAVISEAATDVPNVVALVYVAAFAPDTGESLAGLAAAYPPSPTLEHLIVDDQGDSLVEPSAFVRYFAPDLPPVQARVLAAVQHPFAVAIFATPAGPPAWRTLPTYYQVSLEDQAINPSLERFFAERMGAETIELHSSHVSLASHPVAISELIERAACVGRR
jgi:pimeloyl-ACP methyl ester carboxylesterase